MNETFIVNDTEMVVDGHQAHTSQLKTVDSRETHHINRQTDSHEEARQTQDGMEKTKESSPPEKAQNPPPVNPKDPPQEAP